MTAEPCERTVRTIIVSILMVTTWNSYGMLDVIKTATIDVIILNELSSL